MKTMKTMKRAIPLVGETCIRAPIGENFQKKSQVALCKLYVLVRYSLASQNYAPFFTEFASL